MILSLTLLALSGTGLTIFGESDSVRVVRRAPEVALNVLGVIAPVLYVIGFWLFTAREERYRR